MTDVHELVSRTAEQVRVPPPDLEAIGHQPLAVPRGDCVQGPVLTMPSRGTGGASW